MIQAESLRTLEMSLAGPAKTEIRYELMEVEQQSNSQARRVLINVFVNGPSTANPQAKGFVYGLWREDCVELFIANRDTGRYVEFNFSPSGAWWSRVFEGIRMPANSEPPLCEAVGHMGNESWSVEASVELDTIRAAIGGDPSTWVGNLIVLVGGCDDTDPDLDNLHSLATFSCSHADFHRPQDFLPFRAIFS
ncbi:MAG TPA: hypothetical protein PKA27_05530 [Fimbriimonadaceae bacterium]|nr:hypothetical protein [Fimbriimonadaceae bacterium]